VEEEDQYLVHGDETNIIFLKIIEQSIRDYFNLSKSIVPIEIQYFESASGFLFDDDYFIHWGDYEISLENILNYLQIDVDWFRKKLLVILER
jgi:hypothetical protein